ncbi:hypothetical protein Lfu02_25320 [Longispora fulva]|uniref:Choice-of-anchor D domain-containing protein n=1 Tax=Longispora fulva TaxID=619741 RepID=A0A8J7GX08_9ACTN|nr:hypothetical protein [Longispora fulva]MBG6139456.1 hypothetical protein [Longispora fulva]GIG58160.1 hypothetical protein Lfu02_25320 [Longispora fulva]
MRLFRSAITAVVALTVTAVISPSPASAVAPTAPYDALTVDRWGANFVFDKAGATVGQFSTGEIIDLRASTADHNFSLSAGPPKGTLWEVGKTYPTERGNTATAAGLDVSGDGSGCNQLFGTITIREATRDSAGNLTAFAAGYATGCENTEIAYRGEARWHSTVPYAAAQASPGVLDFGDQAVKVPGAEKQVTFTSAGSAPTKFGTPVFEGTGAGAYRVSGGTCGGATLSFGQTCTVKVQAQPVQKGDQPANLILPANMADGKKAIALSMNSVDPWAGAKGTYTTLNPSRILDTRSGNGAPVGPIGRAGTLHLQVGGRSGVPESGVSAVTLNVTVTQQTTSGFLTVYPAGIARPNASSLNFTPGWTGANSVTVAVSASGGVDIYNHEGDTHVIVDVTGYFSETQSAYSMNGLYHPLTPRRLIDTRDGDAKLPSGYYLRSALDFGAANQHIKAWAVNVTATEAESDGFLTAWNGRTDTLRETSTLNYRRDQNVPNMAIVPVAACWGCGASENWPSIGVYTLATTHVIVDIVGFFDDGTYSADGLRFDPVTPTRIVDTRDSLGVSGPLGQASTTKVTAPAAILSTQGGATSSLALNVTAVDPTALTFMSVWANGVAGQDRPAVSNLNPSPGKVTPNAAITQIGPSSAFNVYNHAGNVQLVVDVVGRYFLHPTTAGAALRMAAPIGTPTIGASYTSAFRAP